MTESEALFVAGPYVLPCKGFEAAGRPQDQVHEDGGLTTMYREKRLCT